MKHYGLLVVALGDLVCSSVYAASVVVPAQIEFSPPELSLSVSQNVSFGVMPKPRDSITCSLEQDGATTEACGLVGAQVGRIHVTGSEDVFVQVSGTGHTADGFAFTPKFMGPGATPGESIQFQMSPVGIGDVVVFGDLAIADPASVGVGMVSFSTTVTMTYN